jgi:DNA-binding transcriptional ArsR family regulator
MPAKRLLRRIDPAVLARAADIIKLLGHPERLKIVEVLERGEASVSEIRDAVDVPQAIVSQHLARLRGANVVAARRDGVARGSRTDQVYDGSAMMEDAYTNQNAMDPVPALGRPRAAGPCRAPRTGAGESRR